jgi:hypothetical protein
MAQCTEFPDVRKVERNPSPTEQEIRTALFQDVVEASVRNSKATREFEEVMGQFPSGLSHSDGVLRIKNASNKLTIARKEMATAHNRLNDYLSRGMVPDDLAERVKNGRHLGGRFST